MWSSVVGWVLDAVPFNIFCSVLNFRTGVWFWQLFRILSISFISPSFTPLLRSSSAHGWGKIFLPCFWMHLSMPMDKFTLWWTIVIAGILSKNIRPKVMRSPTNIYSLYFWTCVKANKLHSSDARGFSMNSFPQTLTVNIPSPERERTHTIFRTIQTGVYRAGRLGATISTTIFRAAKMNQILVMYEACPESKDTSRVGR